MLIGCNSRTDGIVRMKECFCHSRIFALIFSGRFFCGVTTMQNHGNLTVRQKIQQITVSGLFTALSFVLMLLFRIPLFTPFYELEFSDFPLLMCAFVVGPSYSLVSLFIVSILQMLTVSSFSGIIGFIMHFVSSAAMIMIVYFIRKRINGIKGVIISAIAGILVMTAVMIPMNIWLTSVFMKLPVNKFIDGYIGVCIAFNVIKSLCNIILFNILYPVVLKQYNKMFNKK